VQGRGGRDLEKKKPPESERSRKGGGEKEAGIVKFGRCLREGKVGKTAREQVGRPECRRKGSAQGRLWDLSWPSKEDDSGGGLSKGGEREEL